MFVGVVQKVAVGAAGGGAGAGHVVLALFVGGVGEIHGVAEFAAELRAAAQWTTLVRIPTKTMPMTAPIRRTPATYHLLLLAILLEPVCKSGRGRCAYQGEPSGAV